MESIVPDRIPQILATILAVSACEFDEYRDPGDSSVSDSTVDSIGDFSDPPDVPPDTYPPDMYPDTTSDTSPDTTAGSIVGDPCTSVAQCMEVPGTGRLCLTTIAGYMDFPGGYCSASCTSSADCGTNAACVDVMGYGLYCLERCSSDFGCRYLEDYACETLSTAAGLYCVPDSSYPDS
jgi:hypothetical protein